MAGRNGKGHTKIAGSLRMPKNYFEMGEWESSTVKVLCMSNMGFELYNSIVIAVLTFLFYLTANMCQMAICAMGDSGM